MSRVKSTKKNQEPTPEELFQRDLSRVREENINEPTISYEVGEEVSYGALKKAVVTAIYDDGKIYHLTCVSTNRNNQDVVNEIVCAWHHVFPHAPKLMNKEIHHKHDDFHINFYQQQITSLTSRYYYFGVNMNPEYQREFIWTEKQEQSLLDSIFNNIEIGKFVFIQLPFSSESPYGYEILDGKQRLNTIIKFIEGRIKYKGNTIFEMHPSDRNHFENYSVSVAELKEVTKKQIYEYFIKMNTSGISVSEDHLNKVRELMEKEI